MDIQTPDWVKHAVFYQIFPDRFAKRDRPPEAVQMTVSFEPWDSAPTMQGYKGGNLWGVIDRLDYLQDLGITAIYFTPIFQSASNHRYHTHDYYQVDPILGGNEALQELLAAAHQRGLKVVLDGVFNHASRGFLYFNDILENGPYSPWVDWFKIHKWPVSAYDGDQPANYDGWVDNRALPEFNHDHPDVREYIMRVGEYWLRQGIDGWRLDVPYEVETPGFWQEFRDRVKAINPDAYIVGEVWRDSRQWLDGTQFDGVMNYLFTGPTIAFTGGDRVKSDLVEGPDYYPYPPLNAKEYAAKIQDLIELYPWEIQLTQLNILDSHDTARLLSVVQGDKGSVELATLLLFTYPGAPSIYYGNEVGLPGALDPDSRRTFPKEKNWDQPTLAMHKQLIALRHQYTALRTGKYEVLVAEGLLYGFKRVLEGSEVFVFVNAGMDSATTTLEVGPSLLTAKFGQPTLQQSGQTLQVSLPPRSGCILAN
ncbi:glycoside hydrolase family 13 protein [Spirulina sp. CS-785/01]|uniref:glycoside hydrolase family 13 protein n=1 Tax=Spirulina sp. CS-785/01 TaxID=3021716 RepID=UPI00232CB3DF|nr:glycoside hydrolase family 13 protein [Spirulina sp. CS-785/01]MDB9312882.1 glycoside hydrolase family 13 protein [Spirulina sp. CS-785/01]